MKYLRAHGGTIAVEGLVNIVLPFVVYSLAKPKVGDVNGLLASMVLPLAWSASEFVRRRRIDAFSILIVVGIALSLAAFIGGGSVRFLQLRENFVTGLVGLAFLLSAAIGKPLIYQLARASMARTSPAQAQRFEALKDNVYFKRSMTVMTVVWGAGFIVQTTAACALVFAIPIAAYLVVSPIMSYGTIGLLALWTFWYAKRQQRIGAARQAAAGAGGPPISEYKNY